MVENTPEDTTQVAEEYDLHVRIDGSLKEKIHLATQLAYKMGIITEPKLNQLLSIFVIWGLRELKTKYLERMGAQK